MFRESGKQALTRDVRGSQDKRRLGDQGDGAHEHRGELLLHLSVYIIVSNRLFVVEHLTNTLALAKPRC